MPAAPIHRQFLLWAMVDTQDTVRAQAVLEQLPGVDDVSALDDSLSVLGAATATSAGKLNRALVTTLLASVPDATVRSMWSANGIAIRKSCIEA